MYDNADYASSRLHGTIVRIGNDPITVDFCEGLNNGDIRLVYHRLIDGEVGQISLNKVNLVPVPLGFAYAKSGLSYLARIPKRSDYRQGLRTSNYTSLWGADPRFVSKTSLYRTITGKYPCFEQSLDEVINTGLATPFSRDFALVKEGDDVKVLYKWKGIVGDVINNIPALLGEFEYVQEAMEESLNG